MRWLDMLPDLQGPRYPALTHTHSHPAAWHPERWAGGPVQREDSGSGTSATCQGLVLAEWGPSMGGLGAPPVLLAKAACPKFDGLAQQPCPASVLTPSYAGKRRQSCVYLDSLKLTA